MVSASWGDLASGLSQRFHAQIQGHWLCCHGDTRHYTGAPADPKVNLVDHLPLRSSWGGRLAEERDEGKSVRAWRHDREIFEEGENWIKNRQEAVRSLAMLTTARPFWPVTPAVRRDQEKADPAPRFWSGVPDRRARRQPHPRMIPRVRKKSCWRSPSFRTESLI